MLGAVHLGLRLRPHFLIFHPANVPPLSQRQHEMPTPESQSFLAKKPTVPPTFEGVDFSDSEAVANARDAVIREQWVQVMMARLVREEMGKLVHLRCLF